MGDLEKIVAGIWNDNSHAGIPGHIEKVIIMENYSCSGPVNLYIIMTVLFVTAIIRYRIQQIARWID